MPVSEKSLVIVEDEPVIAIMIEEIATDLGWGVAGCAASEAGAQSLLDRCSPSIALVDINLGGEDGLAVAQTCRARGIGVILMTGYTMPEIPSSLGNPPLLSKPFTAEALAAALSRSLGIGVAGCLGEGVAASS